MLCISHQGPASQPSYSYSMMHALAGGHRYVLVRAFLAVYSAIHSTVKPYTVLGCHGSGQAAAACACAQYLLQTKHEHHA